MANFSSNNLAFPGAGADSRSAFITRTYTHLVGGILGFVLVELGLFESGLAEQIFRLRFQMGMGQNEGLKKYRNLRRERARLLTVLKEKGETAAVPVATPAPVNKKKKKK